MRHTTCPNPLSATSAGLTKVVLVLVVGLVLGKGLGMGLVMAPYSR
jgi:hypothetical protein